MKQKACRSNHHHGQRHYERPQRMRLESVAEKWVGGGSSGGGGGGGGGGGNTVGGRSSHKVTPE